MKSKLRCSGDVVSLLCVVFLSLSLFLSLASYYTSPVSIVPPLFLVMNHSWGGVECDRGSCKDGFPFLLLLFGVLFVLLLLVLSPLFLTHISSTLSLLIHQQHHHHRVEEDEPTYQPPPPPPGFWEAVQNGEFNPESATSGAPQHGVESMRFASVRLQDALTAAADGSSDIVKSVYDVLAKKRDANVEEVARVLQNKANAQKAQEEASEKYKELQDRASMLTRLQYCLEGDKRNDELQAKLRAAQDEARAAEKKLNGGGDSSSDKKEGDKSEAAVAKKGEEQKLATEEKDIQTKTTDLQRREADIQRREKILQERVAAVAKRESSVESKDKLTSITKKGSTAPQAICPGSCAAKGNCGDCTTDTNCGWCDSTQSCQNILDGGRPSNCSATDFSHLFCKKDACSAHTDCHSCMADPRCGFCRSSGKCMTGTLTGPKAARCTNWNYASKMKFLSLNIYGRDLSNTTARGPAILKFIQQANADFVALQEVEDWFLEQLSQQKWASAYHASDFGSGHAPGGLLTLSKYKLASVSYYEKTQPGQVEVDQRGRLLVVKPALGDETFAVANTALDWRSADNRADSLDFVFAQLNTTQDSVLMGDFNFDEGAEPESTHIAPNFADVWRTMRADKPGYTWDPINNKYAKVSDPKSRPSRIDRQYVSKGWSKINSVSKVGSEQVSPHYGLLSEVQVYGAYC